MKLQAILLALVVALVALGFTTSTPSHTPSATAATDFTVVSSDLMEYFDVKRVAPPINGDKLSTPIYGWEGGFYGIVFWIVTDRYVTPPREGDQNLVNRHYADVDSVVVLPMYSEGTTLVS